LSTFVRIDSAEDATPVQQHVVVDN
jgi:hypothetical protein